MVFVDEKSGFFELMYSIVLLPKQKQGWLVKKMANVFTIKFNLKVACMYIFLKTLDNLDACYVTGNSAGRKSLDISEK